MSKFLNGKDTVRGNAGIVSAKINGEVIEMFYVSKFEMNVDIEDIAVVSVGTIVTQHKKGMMNITGSLEIYGVTSDFKDVLETYKRTQKYPYFSFVGTNNDPESSAGTQRIKYTDVSFNTLPLQLIDNSAGVIKETIDVVANGYEILEKYDRF